MIISLEIPKHIGDRLSFKTRDELLRYDTDVVRNSHARYETNKFSTMSKL